MNSCIKTSVRVWALGQLGIKEKGGHRLTANTDLQDCEKVQNKSIHFQMCRYEANIQRKHEKSKKYDIIKRRK